MNSIKRTILIIIIIFFNISFISGQKNKVPPFGIVQPSGKVFKAQNLPFGKPIIIIYFSPECDDCQHLIKNLTDRINDFKGASIAMITYLSVESVKKFYNLNHLDKYSNIYIGTEGNYLLVKEYYNIDQFPFIALYNKDGDLIKKYNNKEIDLSDLSEGLKKLF